MNYDFGNKRQYRRTLWNYVDKHSETRKCDRKLLYLESPQAEETEFLVRQKGYRPHQLFPVSKSPAECAWITRNSKGRGITGFNLQSGPVETVLADHARSGIFFDAINLDFTSCLSESLFQSLQKVASYLRIDSIVAITILRGREHWNDFVAIGDRDGLDGDDLRVRLLHCCFCNPNSRLTLAWPKVGQYRSTAGNQTMLFRVGVVVSLPELHLQLDRANNLRDIAALKILLPKAKSVVDPMDDPRLRDLIIKLGMPVH